MANPHRYQQVPVAGSPNVYDMAPVPGSVTEPGTPINRTLLMALQGFYGQTTEFNPDGSITETNQDGHVKTTTFNPNGSITETFAGGGSTITKTTTFNPDGSISEAIL